MLTKKGGLILGILLVFTFSLGFVSSATCVDEDFGDFPYIPSYVEMIDPIGGSFYFDECLAGGIVREYICSCGDYSYIDNTCPGGCATDGTGAGYCLEACIDPDGTDEYTQSVVTYISQNGVGSGTNLTDYCNTVTSGVVNEYICQGSSPTNQQITCPSGICSDGACVHTCTETDSGSDPYNAGTTTFDGTSTKDNCESSDELREYYCGEDDTLQNNYVVCTNGCSTNGQNEGYCEPEVDPTIPILINPGAYGVGTTTATLRTSTDIYAECRYHASATSFSSMTAFSTTGTTLHVEQLTGLSPGTTYSYNFLCKNVSESILHTDISFTTSLSTSAMCGDGVVNQAWEFCDDPDLNGETCRTVYGDNYEGTLACTDSCTFTGCYATCPGGFCGDNIIEPPEECEGLNLNGASCTSLGWTNGTLSCYSNQTQSGCSYDTSLCSNESGGGGIPGGNETGDINVRWVDNSLTRDPYSSITMNDNETVYVIMAIGNSSLVQGEATFDVWEDDGLLAPSQMDVTNLVYNPEDIPGLTIPANNVGAVLALNSTLFDQENEPSGVYEFYFIANDNSSWESAILEVTVRDSGAGGGEAEGYWTNPVGDVITNWTYSISSNQVALVIDNSGLPEGPVTFTIEEEDTLGDDTITTITGNVDATGKALGLWTMIDLNFEDADPENDDIYEFKFNTNGIESSILEVEYGEEIIDCVGISYCSNYIDSDVCAADACLVANATGAAQGIDCTLPGTNCECVWDAVTDTCGLGSEYVDPDTGTGIGSCQYSEDLSQDDCDDGFLSYSWTANFVWDVDNNATSSQGDGWVLGDDGFWHYDPNGAAAECISGSNTVPCPAQIQLNFFTAINILGALIIIFVIYYLLRAHKRRELEKKAKKSKKKVRKKRK